MDFGAIDTTYGAHLATIDPALDGPIWMVNFMKYKERADYGGDGPEISGRAADDRYAPVEVLAAIGAEVAYFGDVIDGDGTWDRMGIVVYPTRRSFIEMQSRRDFKDKLVHKEAGMAFTVIMCALPAGPVRGEGDDSGIVRFIAEPSGSTPEPTVEGALFEVEGTIIGDDRRWGSLRISWTDGAGEIEGADTMVVRSRALIDQIRNLVGEASGD